MVTGVTANGERASRASACATSGAGSRSAAWRKAGEIWSSPAFRLRAAAATPAGATVGVETTVGNATRWLAPEVSLRTGTAERGASGPRT